MRERGQVRVYAVGVDILTDRIPTNHLRAFNSVSFHQIPLVRFIKSEGDSFQLLRIVMRISIARRGKREREKY